MSPSANDLRASPHRSAMANSICEAARAKVNLTLHIKGKRRDGYHELESLVVFADVSDELVFTPASEDRLSLEGPFAGLVDGENLVLKAKRAFASWLGVTVSGDFRLKKNIPVAAGLGGGSSDAAAAIRALSRSMTGTRTPRPSSGNPPRSERTFPSAFRIKLPGCAGSASA